MVIIAHRDKVWYNVLMQKRTAKKTEAKKVSSQNHKDLSYTPLAVGLLILCIGILQLNSGGSYSSCSGDAMCELNAGLRNSVFSIPVLLYGVVLAIMWSVKYIRYKVENKPVPDATLFLYAILWTFVISICGGLLFLLMFL